MSEIKIQTTLSGIPVGDIENSVLWYSKLFGRIPDLRPLKDVAEWDLNQGARIHN